MSVVAIPDEERAQKETFEELVQRLSRQSVAKHYLAFRDIDWDAPEMRIVPTDPRFELPAESPLGGTTWYQAQHPDLRARIGLHAIAQSMKVGLQFENVLSRGLLVFAVSQPNRSPSFRYAMHEVIEESQHSLMFQEFVDRSGIEAAGVEGVGAKLAEPVVQLAKTFPELFFLFVLGGEDPIDYLQRTALKNDRVMHPLLRRISQIHITEEARHLCFARQYLRDRVPALSPARRRALKLLAPGVLHLMVKAMLAPSQSLIQTFHIPDDVVDEAWRKNPRHAAAVRDSLGKVRALCEELGIVDDRTRPLWRTLGIAS